MISTCMKVRRNLPTSCQIDLVKFGKESFTTVIHILALTDRPCSYSATGAGVSAELFRSVDVWAPLFGLNNVD